MSSDANANNRRAPFVYSSRWTVVPRVIAMSALGAMILLGIGWGIAMGQSIGGIALLAVLGALSLLGAWLQWRRPQIVLTADGIRDPRVDVGVPWADVAGVRYIDYPRHRQLHVWLRDPAAHSAYVSRWLGGHGDGSEERPLVFGIDRTSGVTVWEKVTRLPAAAEVELIHETSDAPDIIR